ncbi:hypothetical protein ACYOEI_00235 [Singulisphaera rosea]
MTDRTRGYRNMLSKASRDNQTGLPNNVWAMIMESHHEHDLTRQDVSDLRQEIRKLKAELSELKTRMDQE